MRTRMIIWPMLVLLAAASWLLGAAFFNQAPDEASRLVVPLPSPTPVTEVQESWLKLPPLSANASEADIGAEIYALVCRDCHGDRGQGLTDEFRATWAPEDQNCWQSKCHASNHPIEGFDLPRYVPAIVGTHALAQRVQPSDLYDFIRANMPWHNPGSLTDEEYRQLTAYIMRENGLELIELGSLASGEDSNAPMQ